MAVRRMAALVVAGLLAGAGAGGGAQAKETAEAPVSVLHAVPGATFDVYVNGKPLLTNFKPGTLTDPAALPAGSYDLKVTKAGARGQRRADIQGNHGPGPGGRH